MCIEGKQTNHETRTDSLWSNFEKETKEQTTVIFLLFLHANNVAVALFCPHWQLWKSDCV